MKDTKKDSSRYQPSTIEPKWQKQWQETSLYEIDLDEALKSKQEKFYAFGMFNYPSGAGIHVGHVKNFVIPDVLLRFKRQQGAAVYAPVGFDSFGSPAENFALKTGISPRETIDQAIAAYSQQYRACGFSFDWSKVIDTSRAQYYRWTQWCFLQLHKAGLAYRQEGSRWWCELCCTGLADEQVINGKCWRHDAQDDPLIGRKTLRQWFFKITDYADSILQATDDLDWTPWVKTAQVNYIGRSQGFEIDFSLEGLGLKDQKLPVFTTALETLYGATFLVISPEHPLSAKIIPLADNSQQLADYVRVAQSKSEVARQQDKDKTGFVIQGLTSTNPLTGKKIPVWLADYVLAGYGTGAIMSVPANDERDLAFAKKHDLPIVYTVQNQEFLAYKDIVASPADYKIATDDELNGLGMDKAKQAIYKKLKASGVSRKRINFKLRDWLISRQRYWGAPIPIIFCQKCGQVPVPEADLPVRLPQIKDYKPAGDGRSPLAKVKDWVNVSCPKCQAPARRETDTMDGYVCSSWYQMRYLSANDDSQAWDAKLSKDWLPVDFYNGADHATAHLLYARFFSRFFYEKKLLSTPEPFKRMFLHAKILAPDGQFFSKSKGNGINPLDIIEQGYGADSLRLYLCSAAPLDIEVVWDENGVPGAFRFLSRVFALVDNYLQAEPSNKQQDDDILRATHICIDKTGRDIQALKFNTAVSSQREFVNELYKIAQERGFASSSWKFALESLCQLLAPFAPHLASELWQKLGNTKSLHIDCWPKLEQRYLDKTEIILPIQINGKLRARIKIDSNLGKQEVLAQAKKLPKVASYLQKGKVLREVYVPQKIVNFVVK